MRALHLVAIPQLTGAAEPVLDMLVGLTTLGVHTDIRIDTRREGNFAEVLRSRGIQPEPGLVLSTTAGPAAALSDLGKLKRIISEYDVVHAHLSHDHTLAAMARGRKRRPKIIRTIHAARAFAPGVGRRFLLTSGADRITVSSSADKAALVAAQPVSADRVVVLRGSVDRKRFFPDEDGRRRARQALGLADEQLVFGSVARFQAGRRHEQMIDAFSRAHRQRPELRLVLIGHGETEPDLRARVKGAELSEVVIFAGYKGGDLNDYLNALDAALWLVPGNDSTSRAVLQAMAAGVCVIGGKDGAIEEAIVGGQTGLLVSPDDVAELTEAMLSLASDRALGRRMGEAAIARVEAEYDPVGRAKRLVEIYESALGGDS